MKEEKKRGKHTPTMAQVETISTKKLVDDPTNKESSGSVEEYPFMSPLGQRKRLSLTRTSKLRTKNQRVTLSLNVTPSPEGTPMSKKQ